MKIENTQVNIWKTIEIVADENCHIDEATVDVEVNDKGNLCITYSEEVLSNQTIKDIANDEFDEEMDNLKKEVEELKLLTEKRQQLILDLSKEICDLKITVDIKDKQLWSIEAKKLVIEDTPKEIKKDNSRLKKLVHFKKNDKEQQAKREKRLADNEAKKLKNKDWDGLKKRKENYKEKECLCGCGKKFIPTGPASKYHPDCAKKVNYQKELEWKKNHGKDTNVPTKKKNVCITCGKPAKTGSDLCDDCLKRKYKVDKLLKKTEEVITPKSEPVKNEFNRSFPNPEWQLKRKQEKENQIPISDEILDPFNINNKNARNTKKNNDDEISERDEFLKKVRQENTIIDKEHVESIAVEPNCDYCKDYPFCIKNGFKSSNITEDCPYFKVDKEKYDLLNE